MPPKPAFPTSLTALASDILGIPRATKMLQATLINGEYLCVVHDDGQAEYLVHDGWLFKRTEGWRVYNRDGILVRRLRYDRKSIKANWFIFSPTSKLGRHRDQNREPVNRDPLQIQPE